MQHNPLLLALLALVLSAASTTVVHAQQELALGSQLGPGQPDGQQQEQRVVLQPGRNVALPQRIPLAVGGSPGQGAGVTVFAIVGNISSSPSQPGSRQPCMAVLDLRQLLPPLDNATDVPSSTTLAAEPLFSVSPNTTLRMQSLSLWLPRNTTPSSALPVVDRNALSLQAYLGAVLAQLPQYSVLTPSLLQLVNVTLVEPRCGRLQRLQNYTCMQPAWSQWEVCGVGGGPVGGAWRGRGADGRCVGPGNGVRGVCGVQGGGRGPSGSCVIVGGARGQLRAGEGVGWVIRGGSGRSVVSASCWVLSSGDMWVWGNGVGPVGRAWVVGAGWWGVGPVAGVWVRSAS